MVTKAQLRAARSLLDYSQAFIAKSLETDQRNISNLEKGEGQATGMLAPAIEAFFQSRGIENHGVHEHARDASHAVHTN